MCIRDRRNARHTGARRQYADGAVSYTHLDVYKRQAVSICVPLYNTPQKYLRQLLASVFVYTTGSTIKKLMNTARLRCV